MWYNTVVCILVLALIPINAYNILVIFPTASYSHQIGQQVISNKLASKGHSVTIISPNTFKTDNPNVTQVDVSFLYKLNDEFLEKMAQGIGTIELLGLLTDIFPRMINELLSDEDVKKAINKKGYYDAVVVENLGFTPIFAVAEHLNVPLIGYLSTQMFPASHAGMGNPTHPVLHPPGTEDVSEVPGFFERCKLFYAQIVMDTWFYHSLLPAMDLVIKKHFNIKLNSLQLLQRVDFTIEGFAKEINNIRPLLPNTIQVGLMHVKQPMPLPDNLNKYLSKSSAGVIYASLGSNIKSTNVDAKILQIFKKVFAESKYNVLWKYENDTYQDKPVNVMTQKWLPQQDVLAHKNIKLFVTQGGQQSLEEAIDRQVPVLVVPFMADQIGNAKRIEALGIGLSIKPAELTVEAFSASINELIENPKYKTAVQTLSKQIKDAPMSPVDTAVWWIEYTIRNGGTGHLKYKGTNISFIEYYLIDIILFHIVILSVVLYVVAKLMIFCLNVCRKLKGTKNVVHRKNE